MRLVSTGRHGQQGLYSLADLPQRKSLAETAIGPGWPEMDELWKIYPGQFTVVTGIAGHGKSTFLLNVVCNLTRQHQMRTFIYTPENETHLLEKMKLLWGEHAGFEQFSQDFCFVQSSHPEHYDSAPKTLNWVLDKAIVAIEQDYVDLVLIDPWNELERAKPKEQLLTDYIGECLMKLKQFCRSRNIAVILVAHPTKAGLAEGKTPTLADIEGSMNWYNKCDNGLIVVREPTGSVSRVVSAKVREIGAGRRGQCYFYVDEKTGIFTPQYGAVTP